MNKQDPLWRPLEERIAVVRYLMEVGPDCGAVEIMITEIIDAFEFGERLKGAVDPLPAEHPFPYSDGQTLAWPRTHGCLVNLTTLKSGPLGFKRTPILSTQKNGAKNNMNMNKCRGSNNSAN